MRPKRPVANRNTGDQSIQDSSDLSCLIGPVAHLLLGPSNPSLSTEVQLRYGRRGSLSIDLRLGVWHDFEIGQGGGVLNLIEREIGLTGAAAHAWIDQHLDIERSPQGRSDGRQRTTSTKGSRGSLASTSRSMALWGVCSEITADDPAGAYLRHRGCALPPAGSHLRWIPRLEHPDGWPGPALVALITDVLDGTPLSLLRTWIDPTRPGQKAPIERPRLLLAGHPKQGGVVRLWPDDALTYGLAVGEGVETMLAVGRGFQPAWATIDAGNLAVFPVLHGIEANTIIADHDRRNPRTGKRAGIEAALTLARRYVEAGFDPARSVRIWTAPSEGADFADLAVEEIEG